VRKDPDQPAIILIERRPAIITSSEPAGLKLSSYIWGFQNLSIFLAAIGLGTAAGQMAIVLVYCVYMIYLFAISNLRQNVQRDLGNRSIMNRFGLASRLGVLLLIWAALSIVWTPSRSVVAIYYMAYLVQVAISYMLCKLYPIRDVFHRFCLGMGYATAASTPLTLLLSGSGSAHMGDISDKLTLFAVIAWGDCLGIMAVMYLMWERSISKRRATLLTASLLAGLYLTFGKTEIIALALTGVIYVLLAPGTSRRRVARILFILAGIGLGWIATASKIDKYMGDSGSAATLSGRLILWTQTFAQIINGPYIRGFGFYAFQEIGPNPWRNPSGIVHAHNEFLQVWFNFGLIGVALVFGSYFALGLTSLKALKQKERFIPTLILSAVVFCLIRGLAEANVSLCLLPIPWLFLFDCLLNTPARKMVWETVPERLLAERL